MFKIAAERAASFLLRHVDGKTLRENGIVLNDTSSLAEFMGALDVLEGDVPLGGLETGISFYAEMMPIFTAPKNGTRIIIYLPEPFDRFEIVRWYAPWSNWQRGDFPSDPMRDDVTGIGSAVPIGWMPLPRIHVQSAAQRKADLLKVMEECSDILRKVERLEAKLVKGDALAAAAKHEREMVCQDMDLQMKAYEAVDVALMDYLLANPK